MYIADFSNNKIKRVPYNKKEPSFIYGTKAYGTADGNGCTARFHYPLGLTVDKSTPFPGDILVVEYGSSKLRRLKPNGDVITIETHSSLRAPGGVAMDYTDNSIVIADTGNNAIKRIDTAGQLSVITGKKGYRDGPIDVAEFADPYGVAVDKIGNIYVADHTNNCIRKITISTGMVTTIAGCKGSSGYKDGAPNEALFSRPSGVAIDVDGNLLVADSDNRVIRKIYGIGNTNILQQIELDRIFQNSLSNFSCNIGGKPFYLHSQILSCRAPLILNQL